MHIKNTNILVKVGTYLLVSCILAGCKGSTGPAGPQGQSGPNTPPPTLTNLTCVSGTGGALAGTITNNNSGPAFCQFECPNPTSLNQLILMVIQTPISSGAPTAFTYVLNNTPNGAATYNCLAYCFSNGEFGVALTTINCT